MAQASSMSLAERFRLALDFCDAAGARAEATPVISELRPKQVSFSELPTASRPSAPQWAAQPPVPPPQAPPNAYVARPPEAPSAEDRVSTSNGGSTLRAVAIVAGVLLLALGGWFVRQRFIEPFFARKRQTQKELLADEDERQVPIMPRKTTSWAQQAQKGSPRRVSFVSQPEDVYVTEPQRPQQAHRSQPAKRQPQSSQAPDKKREALLAAQKAAAARNAQKAAQLAAEEESDEDQDEGASFFPAAEPADPNFTEL